jgi:organic hydroperoxide reductase OsmC/OhrA
MRFVARIENSQGEQEVRVQTGERRQVLAIPARRESPGSSVNGGELLLAALATCYCNDIYREAATLNIQVERVIVEAEAEFGAPGEPAQHVIYRAKVAARASEEEIRALMELTDQVAEIQNTLRMATPVRLASIEAESV